jgi:hypothetical protein
LRIRERAEIINTLDFVYEGGLSLDLFLVLMHLSVGAMTSFPIPVIAATEKRHFWKWNEKN